MTNPWGCIEGEASEGIMVGWVEKGIKGQVMCKIGLVTMLHWFSLCFCLTTNSVKGQRLIPKGCGIPSCDASCWSILHLCMKYQSPLKENTKWTWHSICVPSDTYPRLRVLSLKKFSQPQIFQEVELSDPENLGFNYMFPQVGGIHIQKWGNGECPAC